MLHRARGLGLKAMVYEAAPSVGGTWYWNRYPDARVDVESQEYSYSFSEELSREWKWSERYAFAGVSQPCGRPIRPAPGHSSQHQGGISRVRRVWHVTDNKGGVLTARFVIMATGCLSKPQVPHFPGLDRFEGEV